MIVIPDKSEINFESSSSFGLQNKYYRESNLFNEICQDKGIHMIDFAKVLKKSK
jgi:hypothetical protein